jgi:DNA invertase Pin-like site-specific DNA recombinase
MAEGKFVSYLRVSTDKQGRSGLGIEAQREAVERYLNGGRWSVAAEYVETRAVGGQTVPSSQLPSHMPRPSRPSWCLRS